jgi:VanZ family protein
MSPVGKSEVKTVLVPRAVTVGLLVAVSALIALSVYWLSGRATMHERFDFGDLLALVKRYDRGSAGNEAVLATIAPAAADVLLFIPWGAMAFLAFDRGESRRMATYALVMAVGVAFALGLFAWQNRLPTRVTGWYDALWNSAGCAAGAVLGDLRKRVRIRFH